MLNFIKRCLLRWIPKPLKRMIKGKGIGLQINVIARMYDNNRRLIKEQKGHNALTEGDVVLNEFNARVMILQRMSGDNDGGDITSDDSVITNMELGTGSPDDDGLGTPYGAFSTIESIDANPVWDYGSPFDSVDLTFSTSWNNSYDAISGVTEAALYNNNNEPLAIKTFSPALSKTSLGTITLEWTITLA